MAHFKDSTSLFTQHIYFRHVSSSPSFAFEYIFSTWKITLSILVELYSIIGSENVFIDCLLISHVNNLQYSSLWRFFFIWVLKTTTLNQSLNVLCLHASSVWVKGKWLCHLSITLTVWPTLIQDPLQHTLESLCDGDCGLFVADSSVPEEPESHQHPQVR